MLRRSRNDGKQVRPWLAKPKMTAAPRVRESDRELTSQSHQGQRHDAAHKVRMYGCNLVPSNHYELSAWQTRGRPCTVIAVGPALSEALPNANGAARCSSVDLSPEKRHRAYHRPPAPWQGRLPLDPKPAAECGGHAAATGGLSRDPRHLPRSRGYTVKSGSNNQALHDLLGANRRFASPYHQCWRSRCWSSSAAAPPPTPGQPADHAGRPEPVIASRRAGATRTRKTWSSSRFRAAARAPPRFRTASSSSCAAPKSSGRRATRSACSTSRRDHRRVGRQLHRAGLRSLR